MPAASPATVVAGIVPDRVVDGAAAPTPRAAPEPSAPAESMKYSPAVMSLLSVEVSLAAAAIATAWPFAADGVNMRAVVAGPAPSTFSVTEPVAPQLPAASLPCT